MKEEKKKINKREQKFTTALQKWMRYHMDFTYCWEVKYPAKDKIYFSSDKSIAKEITNLKICGRKFIYKNSDAGAVGTPFDGQTICNAPGYFFITFNGKKFYVIEVSEIEAWKKLPNVGKYLDEETCIHLAHIIGEIGKL